MDLYEEFLKYYKFKMENKESFEERVALEEKDIQKVIASMRDEKFDLGIKSLSSLARILSAAKNISFSNGKDYFQEIIKNPQVVKVMEKLENSQAAMRDIKQFSEHPSFAVRLGILPNGSTPIEMEHIQAERKRSSMERAERKAVVDKLYKKVMGNMNKTTNTSKFEMAVKAPEILDKIAVMKFIMRTNGYVPSKEKLLVANSSGQTYEMNVVAGSSIINRSDEEIVNEYRSQNSQVQLQSTQKSMPQSTPRGILKNILQSTPQITPKISMDAVKKMEESYGVTERDVEEWAKRVEEKCGGRSHGWTFNSKGLEERQKELEKLMRLKKLGSEGPEALRSKFSQKSITELEQLMNDTISQIQKQRLTCSIDPNLLNILSAISGTLEDKTTESGTKGGARGVHEIDGYTKSQAQLRREHNEKMIKKENAKRRIEEEKIRKKNQRMSEEAEKQRREEAEKQEREDQNRMIEIQKKREMDETRRRDFEEQQKKAREQKLMEEQKAKLKQADEMRKWLDLYVCRVEAEYEKKQEQQQKMQRGQRR